MFFLFDFEFWEVELVGLKERQKWTPNTVYENIYEYITILKIYKNLSSFYTQV